MCEVRGRLWRLTVWWVGESIDRSIVWLKVKVCKGVIRAESAQLSASHVQVSSRGVFTGSQLLQDFHLQRLHIRFLSPPHVLGYVGLPANDSWDASMSSRDAVHRNISISGRCPSPQQQYVNGKACLHFFCSRISLCVFRGIFSNQRQHRPNVSF